MVAPAPVLDEFDDTPWFVPAPTPRPAPEPRPAAQAAVAAPAPIAEPPSAPVAAVAATAPTAPSEVTPVVMPMMPVAFEQKRGAGLVTRAIWYMTVGWWVTGIGMALAWVSAMTIVGLPLSFWLVNRLPTMLTLRPRRERYQWVVGKDGVARAETLRTEQTTPLLRFAWFLLVGWWASALWMLTAYVLLLSIVLTPFGLLMVNRVPFVFSLHRGYA